MITIPAIDLYQGKCVRLRQGQFKHVSVYDISPANLASTYAQQGAQYLHIVDLEGAKVGTPQQLDLVHSMVDCGIPVQAGGGIRTVAHAKSYLERGVAKIVLGSIAISNPPLMQQIINEVHPENIVLALDVHMEQGTPKPAIHGWQTSTHNTLWAVASFYQQLGIKHILCTDIGLDGMMKGPNLDLYKQALIRFPTLSWQASGGIRHQEDIETLAAMGLSGAILGRTLYESDLDLAACFANHG
jgi:phosphoribosylformimino-5-aminoimidazole carboxamide ribotide isomerase